MVDTDKYGGTLREHMQVFDIFSDEKFEHHPFHYHKSILLGVEVEAQLKFHLWPKQLDFVIFSNK